MIETEGQREILALKKEEEKWVASGAGKGKEESCPLELPEGMLLCCCLDFGL